MQTEGVKIYTRCKILSRVVTRGMLAIFRVRIVRPVLAGWTLTCLVCAECYRIGV